MATKTKVQPSGSSWYAIGAQTDTKPKGGKPVKGLTMNQVLGKAPRVTPSGAAGTTIQTPPKTQTVTTTTSTPPGQDWWSSQIGSRVALSASTPVLTAAQNQIGSSYGLTLRRNTTNNQPLFRLANQAAGTGTIEQSGFDSSGNPVYKDAAGNVIDVRQTPVALDYVAIKPGEDGYLEGSLGRTAATSANTQQAIAEAAAARGARRSGMREYGARSETQNLQSALAGLAERAGGEYSANLGKWAELYTQIQQGLLPDAAALAAPTTTTTEVPVAPTTTTTAGPTTAGGATVPQKPLAQPKAISIAGQTVNLPKGIDLTGVGVEGIGRRIAQNVAGAGGVGKLKNGQMVGQFRAGDKGYRVVYRGGKFVVELAG